MSAPGKTFRVGEISATKVEEQFLQAIPPSFLYPALTPEDFERVKPAIANTDRDESNDTLILSVHSWVVRTPRHIILIDTCSGNDKDRPSNLMFHRLALPYLERLAEAGVQPENVDFVFNTHLHVDHSGWNTRLRDGKWVPTFPNARYVLPTRERDYYSSPASHNEANRPSLGVYEDSILPVIEAGLVDFIGPDGGEYLTVFEFIPTTGHSIGHMSIRMSSHGEEAIFAGDVLHHPVQIARPELNSVFCEFAGEAVVSRQKILDYAADSRALYFSTHFPNSSAGFVSRSGGGLAWAYA